MLGLNANSKAKAFLISDAGAGALTDAFLDDALFGENSSWHIDANLHESLNNLVTVQAGVNLIPSTYGLLGQHNPKDKFAMYSTAYDAIQTLFLSIMENQDNPSAWFAGLNFPLWNFLMESNVQGLSSELPNYRRYIDPGCNHTIFRFPEYYSSSLDGISFLDWLKGMTGEKNADNGDWRNLSCSGDCGAASLSVPGVIGSCITRSLGG